MSAKGADVTTSFSGMRSVRVPERVVGDVFFFREARLEYWVALVRRERPATDRLGRERVI